MTTNGRQTGEWLLTFVRENALTVVIAIALAYAWFTSSNTALLAKVERLENEVAEQRATLKSRARFVNEATNQLNYLCHTEPTCRALYSPIAVPE